MAVTEEHCVLSKIIEPVKILVLVSGGGSNLQALLDADLDGRISLVISDMSGAYAIERARLAGVPALLVKPDPGLPKPERRREHSDRILRICRDKKIDLVVHAGFLSILAGDIIEEYSGRMINIHPALLPRYGGQGMYGERVHRAVLAAGETESGCTVHLVDSEIDAGPVLLQRKVPVLPEDTVESLAKRVLGEEHIAIVEAVKMMIGRSNEKQGAYKRI